MKLNFTYNPVRYWLWFPAILIFLMVAFFSFRGVILNKALQTVSSRFKAHEYTVHWDGAGFRGVCKLFFKGIYVQSKDGKNEVFVDSMLVKVRLLPLAVKNIRLKSLQCKSISVRYNPDSLISGQNKPVLADSADIFRLLGEKDLADIAGRYIRRFFNYIPAKTRIGSMELRLLYAGRSTLVALHNLVMKNGTIKATLVFSGEGRKVDIPINGNLNKSHSEITVTLNNPFHTQLPIPVLMDKYGIEAGFDSLSFNINLEDRHRRQVNISGAFAFSGFEVSGERLSTSSIRINRFNSEFLLHVGAHSLELDSTTWINLNRISLRPYLHLMLTEDPTLDLKVIPVTWPAADFFESLPAGMFTSLIGFSASGTLHYFLSFTANLRDPDSLKFNTRLTADNFKILHYGVDDYRSINGSFNHQVYERGQVRASFVVGPPNPDFVPIDQISPFLRAAVMTSEDGSFYFHNGFNPGAFRESIVANIRERRFARGGSTITMQLVKNVFLTRNKTLARKIEEALIVWLIENQNLVSKQRMYEAYLNLIEWGPGVYGINQASRFYFSKSPGELNLQESIYLASLVPHPKWYKYSFESNGKLKPFFNNYFNRMKQLMVGKQFITPDDTVGIPAVVTLTGPASLVFMITDTIKTEPVLLEELDMIPAIVE